MRSRERCMKARRWRRAVQCVCGSLATWSGRRCTRSAMTGLLIFECSFLPPPRQTRMLSSLTLPSLLSRYEAGELIGHGDDASVYRAVDPHTGELVAIKIFDQRMELDASFVANFRREARRASLLRHPNVVRTLAYGYADQHYYLTLEYIDGGSFERLIPASGTTASPQATQALLDACAGLEYIHAQGIIHRNLEPSNI